MKTTCNLSLTLYVLKNIKAYFMLRRITLLLTVTLTTLSTFAQLVVNPNGPITPAQAVQDILIGAGINAFNVTFNGSAANANVVTPSVREFNAGTTNFPIQSGVVMQTQGAPSVNNDPDLTALAGQNVTNGVIIEFDFIPTGDTLSFNYIFGSSEYTNYTCSQFNDVFGFFISGPGISGPFSNGAINIATVPGGNIPVAINTVNSGSPSSFNSGATCAASDPNWQSNSIYFTTSYNTILSSTPNIANFNGATVVLSANADLICNEVFHIKLAVANAVDGILDSGVFLEANSFTSNVVDIAIQAGASLSDSTLIANCTEGIIYFTRPSNQTNDTLVIFYETSGDAIQGVDYNYLSQGDSIVFLPGMDTVIVFITPTNGGPQGSPLSLTVTAQTITDCGDTIYASGTVWLLLEPEFSTSAFDTIIKCRNDEVMVWGNVTGGFPPYSFEWEDGQIGNQATFPVNQENGNYYFTFTATDQCGFTVSDSALVELNQTFQIDSLVSSPTPCGLQEGIVFAYVSGQELNSNGLPTSVLHQWVGPGENGATSPNQNFWGNLSSGWYYYTATNLGCEVEDSIFVDILNPPTANFSVNPNLGYSPLTVNYSNESENASSFYWWFGNGNDLSTDNMGGQTQVFDTIPGVYTAFLVAYEGGCTDTAYATIIILELIPDPQVETPNVFTPNGDGVNDLWKFTILQDVAEVDLVITNRWGNVMFQTTTDIPVWDGLDMGGRAVTEGVYFYRYKATGLNGKILEGHGFIQLHR